MKTIRSLEKYIEDLSKWLERVKVLKLVFIALVGIRLIPKFANASIFLSVAPILFYLLVEEMRIVLESRIRVLQRELSRKEKRLEAQKSEDVMLSRKSKAEKPR